ncbi:hypothetical protein RN001_000158 [Aquatica leii]|uniref:Guanylate cyclase domain-containing protein n=1 Tax=Aquatica leii TaxID=1421715 RepID=A0AAN7PEH2_9COLE|nr:hypothetical protein RN001_000158 [Aquatica leii]
MMEGMNQNVEEEYILAMRINANREDSELWRERKLNSLQSGYGNYPLQRRKTTTKSLLPMSDDYSAKVLASLVPDEIIYNVNDYSNRSYDMCVLLGDVSGFTDLSEMYNKSGKGGPSRLTQVLNSYLGSMVQEILSHNGDILKFSGDAFLAMWKCTANSYMQDVVHAAIDSAIMIQKTLGTYETDAGVCLRVKIAIAAGSAIFSIIGDSKMSHYVVVGQPILDVKLAEKKASPGEIIMSNSAWHYVNPNEFVWETFDGHNTKIKNITPSWRPGTSNKIDKIGNVSVDLYSFVTSYIGVPESDTLSQTSSKNEDEDIENDSLVLTDLKFEDFSIRPSVNYAAKMNLKEDLRKFIIPSIMRGIDLDQPLEYLTEMRQIVIVFLNVVIDAKMDVPAQIELIDMTYRRVCALVDEMQGTVNKLSLFDKDLMFVLLFGLRGYKSELESQMGLRCASECFQALSKLNVLSTSAAVTTGMTYCGVVGHALRREYTVISLTVNKAARLMIAYPGKVTCDRETFLHSKLDAKNFILQEAKPLKGIKNAGPIYEFKEQVGIQGQIVINPFPLLGRSDHVKLYRRLLNECVESVKEKGKSKILIESECFHSILIHGDPRIGKTRMLDEFVYVTPSSIPVNRFTLIKRDEKVPYYTIHRILSMPLGLTELSTIEDKETKLKLRLQKLKSSDWFCSLNKVFNVNFEKSAAYKALSNQNKLEVLQIVIKQLCYVGFITMWVIGIDNAEYIDDESWHFIDILLDMDLVFIVLTMCTNNQFSKQAIHTFNNKKIKIIHLQPIDKWFQAGLACQILNVRAIPPELEKLIQAKSGGNPGWIESFLVSLIQAGGLQIQHMTRTDMNEIGLITPPLEMLTRLSYEEMQNLDERKSSKSSLTASYDRKDDGWNMYKLSYRDSIINLLKEKIREQYTDYATPQPVCVIAPYFKLDEVDPEFSMDVVIIKLFDSLTSYEQMLLKCSSVLGEYFPRGMLVYIMVTATPRPTALAVKKLYELRVLSCARGDFTQGDSCMIFSQHYVNPNQELLVKCYCKGLKIHDTCLDLPKYASCGFLRFRQVTFRETTYNLLTDNQKKEFHNRAIRYLEKETRRCRSCGNGYFVKVLGTRYDEGFIRKWKSQPKSKTKNKKKKRSTGGIEYKKISEDLSLEQTSSQLLSMTPRSSPRIRISDSSSLVRTHSSELFNTKHCLEFGRVYSLKHSFSLTRTFSYADFTTCQCPLILNTMYTQMLEHCKGAGRVDKMMNAMLEYSYICIISCNVPQAIRILEDAQLILAHTELKNDSNPEDVWQIPLTRAKIETLLGYAVLELGQLEDAYLCFIRALHYYGYKFPVSKMKIKLEVFLNELKQRLSMYVFPAMFVATVDGYEAEFYDNVSECLSLLYRVFIDLRMWEHAELAATWSLNKSLASDLDFFGLCTAYKNMLNISCQLGKECLTIALEVNGLFLCHRKRSSIEAHELKAVSELYGAIFSSRFLRSAIEHAIHIGYIMLRITSTIHAVQVSLKVLPLMMHALLARRRISEAVTMIQELEYYSAEVNDNSGKAWFFASCIVLQLETGYTLTPYYKCERFYQIEGDTLINIRDPDAERRFYVVMWLWCLRNDEWESALVWYRKLNKFKTALPDDSINNLITYLYLLEGLLIYIVVKINQRSNQAVTDAKREVASLISTLENASNIAKIISPRLHHMKAYLRLIESKDLPKKNILRKAKKIAEKYDNILELAWMEHSEKAWNNTLSPMFTDFWKQHCEIDNIIDYHEIDLNNSKLGLFTLPTPKYY